MPTPPKQHLAPERLLTPDEVAGMFRVTARTILRWASHGQLKAVTTPGGRLRRFRASDLQAVLEADQTEPPAPDQSDGHLWDGPDRRTRNVTHGLQHDRRPRAARRLTSNGEP